MIQLYEISKSFSNEKVLDNITLDIAAGELVVIKGESGAGKSTLLHIIASLMKPDSGYVAFDGEVITKLTDTHIAAFRREKIGYITQNFYLLEELSVAQNLEAVLVLHQLSQKQRDEKIDKALGAANILHKKDALVSTLSGGEKQRCVIARAIVHEPELLVCDEPTANLDVKNVQFFKDIVHNFLSNNKSVVLATHDSELDDLDARVFSFNKTMLK